MLEPLEPYTTDPSTGIPIPSVSAAHSSGASHVGTPSHHPHHYSSHHGYSPHHSHSYHGSTPSKVYPRRTSTAPAINPSPSSSTVEFGTSPKLGHAKPAKIPIVDQQLPRDSRYSSPRDRSRSDRHDSLGGRYSHDRQSTVHSQSFHPTLARGSTYS